MLINYIVDLEEEAEEKKMNEFKYYRWPLFNIKIVFYKTSLTKLGMHGEKKKVIGSVTNCVSGVTRHLLSGG